MITNKYIDAGADISACGKYRYLLWREWRGTHDRKHWHWFGVKDGTGAEIGRPKAVIFVMLNPSTADGSVDDPTIRKCVGFAKRWNYERIEVMNLFAYRATNSSALLRLGHNENPEGPRNSEVFERLTESDVGIVICAWGANGTHLGQDETILGWIGDKPTYALRLTKDGCPWHPLYTPYETKPFRWNGSK